ncbi:MAG: DUF349 domain-containing protein [Bacteroidota bacterium]
MPEEKMDSVHDEQFEGQKDKAQENTRPEGPVNESTADKKEEESAGSDKPASRNEITSPEKTSLETESGTGNPREEDDDTREKSKEEPAPAAPDSGDIKSGNEDSGEISKKETSNEQIGKTSNGTSLSDETPKDKTVAQETPENTPDEEKASHDKKEEMIGGMPKRADFARMTREELIGALKILLDTKSVQHIRDEVDLIKISFYQKQKAETEKRKKKYLEEGGDPEHFDPGTDPVEEEFKEVFQKYREEKLDLNRRLEEDKLSNLEEKYKIIEEIKELVNSQESLNETFQQFRDLQKRWHAIGIVPQGKLHDLWESYNHNVEKFYDYIKINKELRDLDFKKNLEAKITLCEKAEELLLEPDTVKAFRSLQKFHDTWREIGPVPAEKRVEIWDRFKEATSKINKKHHEYFDNLKEQQKKNLEQKQTLCEKVEELTNLEINNAKEWDKKSKEIIEIQKVWRTIGFAPKKDNAKIYQRFRKACDAFFNKKREFFKEFRDVQQKNMELKSVLCEEAEALKDSSDWRATTERLIAIQKEWKKIGPVPRKFSDQLWKRFRAACDEFFERKSNHFSNIDNTYDENLKKKKELIDEVKAYKILDDVNANFQNIKNFQRTWSEIGFVPIDKKDEIQKEFKNAINNLFDKLDVDENKKKLLQYKTKLSGLQQVPRGKSRMNTERDKYITQLKQLENDIVLWENNIGFFNNTKNAQALIEDVQKKIDVAREKIILLEEKVKMIDNLLDEEE